MADPPNRRHDFPVADADNHLYETRDAFSRHLPPSHDGFVRFINIDGKDQLLLNKRLAFILPNPTLEKVAPPGAYESAERPRVIVSPAHFFDPGPRLEWMRSVGLDRAVLFPTIGLSMEERLDDPLDRRVLIRAYNRWLEEHWSFDYQGAIFTAPMITLADLNGAIEELEWIVERGARICYIQPGLPLTDRGRISMAMPQFDPFWSRVEQSGLVIGMHAGDGGQFRYINEWEGVRDSDPDYFKKRDKGSSAFREWIGRFDRITHDLVGSLICHGLLTRFPGLKILPAEQGTSWVRPSVERLQLLGEANPSLFDEDPVAVFKRNIKVHLFRDPDPVSLVRQLGADVCVFGSDFPHPEGQADPLDFADRLQGLSEDDKARVMGGNLDLMLGIAAPTTVA